MCTNNKFKTTASIVERKGKLCTPDGKKKMAVMNRHENALARAEELAAVGQESSAFQLLHDAILSKHFQHSYTDLEPIMARYLQLGVLLRKGRLLKEGLMAFRSATINVNIAGFEGMTKKLVELCKSKLRENEADVAAGAIALEDLEEADYSPESLWANALASSNAVGSGVGKSEREKVTPWLRFLWEVLRVTIDLCRNNGRLEVLYQQLVNDAVEFCRKYQRKAEFRRLSEILRYHLQLAVKHPNSLFELDVRAEPSMQRQLSIRFALLDLGIELELWQEAFKALEDIHGLYMHANKNPSEGLLLGSEYYEKLCKMLSMTDNYLFLAAAYLKLLESYQSAGRTEGLKEVAERAVLATLAIPKYRRFDPSYTLSAYDEQAKMERMTIFLGSQDVPTRESLVHELSSSAASLCSPSISKLLQGDSGDYTEVPEKYQRPLLLNSVFSKLEAAYNDPQVMEINLKDYSIAQVDVRQFVVNLCRAGEFWGKFDGDKFVFNKALPRISDAAVLELDDLNLNIHSCPFGQVAQKVYEAPKNPIQEERYNQIIAQLNSMYEAFKARKAELDKQREEQALKAYERDQEHKRERALKQQAEAEAEIKRLAEEAARRERERMEKDMVEIRKKEAAMREAEQKRLAEVQAARQNAERLSATLKRMDYFERACRKEEIPLLVVDYEQQKKNDKESYEERRRLIIENAKKRHEHDLGFKHSISVSDFASFRQAAEQRAQSTYEQRLIENADKLEQAKLARKAQVMQMRQEEVERIRAREEARRREMELINATQAPSDANQWRRATPSPVVPAATVSPRMVGGGEEESGGWRKAPASTRPSAPSPANAAPVAADNGKAAAGSYVPPHLRSR